MNTRLQSVSALTLLVAASTPALLPWLNQEPTQDDALQPVPGTSYHQAPSAPQSAPDQGLDWYNRLTQEDFHQRAQAFRQAKSMAARDSQLRGLLTEWAAGQDELAWTCHLLLDQLQTDPFASMGVPRDPGSLFHRAFGADPFNGSGFEQLFGLANPLDLGSPGLGFPGGSGIPMGKSQGYRLEITPDGAKLHIETNGPEGSESQTFEADSLEELQASYPDLLGQDLDLSPELRPLFPSSLRPLGDVPTQPGKIRTDVLGVLVTEVDRGLQISEVFPRTMAHKLGLRPGDTLTELLGRPTATVADVQAALSQWDSELPLSAQWLDSSGAEKTGTWRAAAAR